MNYMQSYQILTFHLPSKETSPHTLSLIVDRGSVLPIPSGLEHLGVSIRVDTLDYE